MKKLFLFVLLSLCILFFVINHALAQTPPSAPTQTTTKYNITFPIAELGNCTDLTSCKEYCNDTSHQDACIAFAKSKGFYKNPSDSSVLAAAEKELGCDSADACKTFCSKEENQQKCSDFAKEHNLSGGKNKNSDSSNTLEKAKEVLGCDSLESCKTFCSKEENQQKCSDFAHQNGLNGGTSKVGPGGCTSESSCSAYCSDPNHANECQQFRQKISSSSAHPTGFDQKPLITPNPSERPTYTPSSYPSYAPSYTPNYSKPSTPPTSPTIAFYQTYCNSHPNCTWTDNQCKCVPLNTPTPTPAVKGVSIHINFFQSLFNFILEKL